MGPGVKWGAVCPQNICKCFPFYIKRSRGNGVIFYTRLRGLRMSGSVVSGNSKDRLA